MRFRIENGSVTLAGKTILDHCNFEIKGKEKIAIVGANGAGKTTLLKVIHGDLPLDVDDKNFHPSLWLARNTTIGMLEQNPFERKDVTVKDWIHEICSSQDPYSKDYYDFEMQCHQMFTRFGLSMNDLDKKIQEFSGGEQTKIAMIRLLLTKPDILILDEPTNHLDIQSILWLEEYIRDYEKAVILVSHDRFFLDQTATVVYELYKGMTSRYTGNYTQYRMQREKEQNRLRKQYKEQQEEIERITKLIDKFNHKPKKAAMARSKKTMLERMKKLPNPEDMISYVYPGNIVPDRISSKTVYDCRKMVIGYDHPLHTINLAIKRGQKIGILGANGQGKSTFLKTLAGLLQPLSGTLLSGTNLETAYYDQMTADFGGEERILEAFHKTYPSFPMGDCRKILARFLFRDQDLHKSLSDLSGGEKCRYTFASLLQSKPNVLLLDEPTNHLDIPSKEVLESAFSKYEGTLLFITHDRYFLKEVAQSLLIFEEGKITYYPYDYNTYLESLRKEEKKKLQGIHTIDQENEALWESFEAVPEKKRMQSARFNQEQSYTDWQLDLITQDLELARWRLEKFLENLPTKDLTSLDHYHDFFSMTAEDWMERKEQYKKMEENYQEACIRWNQRLEDYEEAFADYYDA